jgi:hypothetical protein
MTVYGYLEPMVVQINQTITFNRSWSNLYLDIDLFNTHQRSFVTVPLNAVSIRAANLSTSLCALARARVRVCVCVYTHAL